MVEEEGAEAKKDPSEGQTSGGVEYANMEGKVKGDVTQESVETSERTHEEEPRADEKKTEKAKETDKEKEISDAVSIEMMGDEKLVSVPIEKEVAVESPQVEAEQGRKEETATLTNETETSVEQSKYELDDELPWAMYRSMDSPPHRPPVQEDDDWPASDDDDEEYSKFCQLLYFLTELVWWEDIQGPYMWFMEKVEVMEFFIYRFQGLGNVFIVRLNL